MIQALLQTIANLGIDAEAINKAFNSIINTIKTGDLSSIEGLMGVFRGVISAITGTSATDISMVSTALVTSVLEVLSSAGTSGVLSNITGA